MKEVGKFELKGIAEPEKIYEAMRTTPEPLDLDGPASAGSEEHVCVVQHQQNGNRYTSLP